MKYSLIIPICIALFVWSCSAPVESNEDTSQLEEMSPGPVIDQETTQAVLNHHLEAFGANDLDAIMEDYADEATLITPDATFQGKEQIRAFFEGLFPSFPTEGTAFEMDTAVVYNEAAYILWHATTPTIDVPLGTDTFIILDGKIKIQTFAGVINPVE